MKRIKELTVQEFVSNACDSEEFVKQIRPVSPGIFDSMVFVTAYCLGKTQNKNYLKAYYSNPATPTSATSTVPSTVARNYDGSRKITNVTKELDSGLEKSMLFVDSPRAKTLDIEQWLLLSSFMTSISKLFLCNDSSDKIFQEGVVKILESTLSTKTPKSGVDDPNYRVENGCLMEVLDENLTEIVLPSSVSSISPNLFRFNTEITSIVFPDMMTVIPYECCMGCESLESVVFSNHVTEIGSGAFLQCDSLTSIVIPASVQRIKREAFARCYSLKSIKYLGEKPELEDDVYFGCPADYL